MDTTSRRYTSPARPPRLITRAGSGAAASASPLLCLHAGSRAGHAAPRLVTFEWGRIALSRLGR